jgi:uncharacterized membrane protein (DUF485 family)
MTETHGAEAGRDHGREHSPGIGSEGSDRNVEIDWVAAQRSPEFRELVTKKKAFVLPATIFFLVWYFGFILLAGYAPDFMGDEFLTDGLTVGYALALTQFVMTWVLGWLYLRRSDKVFDPLAERAAKRAIEVGAGRPPSRFERRAGSTPDAEEATRP